MEPGRPPVLDDVKKREICAILAVGCSRAVAARYVGCHPGTIRNTALREEEFALQLEQAESKHEILHLSHINSAAKEGRYWRAAAWALERKYPDRYAQRNPNIITVEQISQVLAQFADVIFEEVTEVEYRHRILTRLNDLTAGLNALPAKGGPA
ncbi:MAG: hypothetical protein HY288_12115 [Planctomycetia bacterium]|nr:hypothetical protein [Planctomycetia bacterium]